ncbi:MAG: D-2-hydroxyacid dehydrogenase [Firmicutes bacterium]|nr:D-2-hydroxyacid dehydrogenase [Bacillota bacterium]
MIKVLANDGIEKGAADALVAAGFEVDTTHYDGADLIAKLKETDAIVIRSATKLTSEIFEGISGGKLKLAIRAGVGIDNIDIPAGEKAGVKVTNTPAASSDSVAELALAHMFAVARHIGISNVTMREGKWEKKNYGGVELSGKTLGLIGFGRIARSLAKKAQALGMSVIYTDFIGEVEGFSDFKFMSENDVIKNSDFISLHIPFDKAKGATISKAQFDMMKDGTYLINCARGGVVDEAALLDALNSGKVAAAGIDVFEKEPTDNIALINHPKVSVTPHIGASTSEAQKRIGAEVVELIKNFAF